MVKYVEKDSTANKFKNLKTANENDKDRMKQSIKGLCREERLFVRLSIFRLMTSP